MNTKQIVEEEIVEAFERAIARVVELGLPDALYVCRDAAFGNGSAMSVQINGGVLASQVREVEAMLGVVIAALASPRA